jgi:hypothetical protein
MVCLSFRYYFLPPVKKKNDLGAVEKAMFQGVRRLCKLFFFLSIQPKLRFGGGQESDVESTRLSVRNHIPPVDHQIMRFARSRERDDSRGLLTLFIHFMPSTQPNMRLGRGRECDDSGGPHSLQNKFLPPWRIKM